MPYIVQSCFSSFPKTDIAIKDLSQASWGWEVILSRLQLGLALETVGIQDKELGLDSAEKSLKGFQLGNDMRQRIFSLSSSLYFPIYPHLPE